MYVGWKLTEYLVTGSSGLVGSAVLKKLIDSGVKVVGTTRNDADLRSETETTALLNFYKPKVVIDCAAKVGGIKINDLLPVDFFLENIEIQNNLLKASHGAQVEKFAFLGSSCIYPKLAPQPISENYLMSGPLEPTNSSYAMAKIAGIQLVNSYRKQFGHNWISIMPTNVYGPNDNFNLETSHVIPALINKFVDAATAGHPEVEVWGSGNARREFIYSDDLASGIVFCLESYNQDGPINVGTGQDLTIRELAYLIAELTGFKGSVRFNERFPDGTPRKLLDVSKINELGWEATTSLQMGLKMTIEWYISTLKSRNVS